jgi:hypothetical protein
MYLDDGLFLENALAGRQTATYRLPVGQTMIINTFVQVADGTLPLENGYGLAGGQTYSCPANSQLSTTAPITGADAATRFTNCEALCTSHSCAYFQYESDLAKNTVDCKVFSAACDGLATFDASVTLYSILQPGSANRCFGADLLETPTMTTAAGSAVADVKTECSGYCDNKNTALT